MGNKNGRSGHIWEIGFCVSFIFMLLLDMCVPRKNVQGETIMSVLDDYMRSAVLKAMMPAVNKVQSDIRDQMRAAVTCPPQFTQTVITINPPRHYPVRAYRRH